VHLVTYAIGQVLPLISGTEMLLVNLVVFVPLTGRMGAEAPAEHIIANMVGILGSFTLPFTLSFFHRSSRATLGKAALVVWAVAIVAIAVFAQRNPFDEMHQKRVFIVHMENVTTNEFSLHVGAADRAPGLEKIVYDVAQAFGENRALDDGTEVKTQLVEMNDWNTEWDTIYPFSAFITPYKIPVARPAGYVSPWISGKTAFGVKALNDKVDKVAGTRSLTLRVDRPGIIWSVIAFDAHVLQWSLDDAPAAHVARHHIKEASFYGVDSWSLDLVVQLHSGDDKGKFNVSFVGINEKAMWPGKKDELSAASGGGSPAMKLFEKMDPWVEERMKGTVEALMIGCVGGVVEI